MVSVIVLVLDLAGGFEAGFGAATLLTGGEQTDFTQRAEASAELGILDSCAELGQATGAFTTGLAGFFGAGFPTFLTGAGVLTFTGTLTVLVMVLVVDDDGLLLEDPTHTVTEPEPRLEPWLSPELEDPPPEQARASWESRPSKVATISTLVKLRLPMVIFLIPAKLNWNLESCRSYTQTKNPIRWMGFF
ncbi:unannotated protein [freshwater metagenome]|uniref:Unannotated protein n=1 Tax=freshwater metagenome TaxID=449393 RepID=A0A6J6IKX6_9ZZZZ|nr:hypothetical protein [Actinomycetota bacterium]